MKVSIVTGTYNSEKYIKDCVNSVHTQTYQNIEHIIIDGASKDNTVSEIKSIPNRITKIISEADNGIYDAMNKGLKNATGEILGILNSDDFYNSTEVIDMIVKTFKETNVDCVFGDLYYVLQNDPKTIKRKWITGAYNQKKGFKTGWHPAHPTFFVKKEIYEKFGYFDLEYGLAADFELMLRFLEKHQIKSSYINFPMVRMRLGGATNKSLKNIYQGNKECIKAFKKNEIPVNFMYSVYRLVPKLKQFF
ncbi:glycosyltransferase family 2 protein [uncultured Maribacter sp.]|uniref:glycosyltransferase family 2 protein n=1 Tax=uncultured Maribacter sp. TaxID=431308 RepID=UPI00261EB756|nr:glycosyltransferase family 2 protein [uncultured Maribacter sp.]